MAIRDALLADYDHEMGTTRRLLERLPDDKLGWKPHEKSFSMGQLASHVANLVKWTDPTMNQTQMDMATVPPEEMNREAASRAQLAVYLRLNNVPVPAIYGPSADEGM